MAHWDFTADNTRVAKMPPGPAGLNPDIDNFVRLSTVPVAGISEIRGRAHPRCGQRVRTGQRHPLRVREGGPGSLRGRRGRRSPRRPDGRCWGRLVGRGRALEILLGGDDIPAALAAEYGHVNRVILDTEIEGFTDAFARRIAAFDKVTVAGIKKLVDTATLPGNDEFAAGLQAFFTTASRPQNLPIAQLLFKHGLQQPDGIETNIGTAIGTLRQTQ